MTIEELSTLIDETRYPIPLTEYVENNRFVRVHKFEDCLLTFIYNTVTCVVSIYNGSDTDSLILEVHSREARFLQRDIQRLVNIVFEKHQGA